MYLSCYAEELSLYFNIIPNCVCVCVCVSGLMREREREMPQGINFN